MERIKDLERGLAAKVRNSQVPGIQRAAITSVVSVTGVTAFTPATVVASLTVNIPSTASQVMVAYKGITTLVGVGAGRLELQESHLGTVLLGDWTTGNILGSYLNYSYTGTTAAPLVGWFNPYQSAGAFVVPNVGSTTYSIQLRNNGATSVGFDLRGFAVVVI
jgi:hypothetical protein